MQDVYGFSMAPIEQEVRKGELEFATVRVVKPEDITTCDACVKVSLGIWYVWLHSGLYGALVAMFEGLVLQVMHMP